MNSEAIIALFKFLLCHKFQSKAVYKIALVSAIVRKAITIEKKIKFEAAGSGCVTWGYEQLYFVRDFSTSATPPIFLKLWENQLQWLNFM